MIATVIMLMLTALMLLIAGLSVDTLVGVMVAVIGSLAVAHSLKSVETMYTSWSYWVKVILKFASILLLTCGCTYRSFYTLIAGLVGAIVLLIFTVVMSAISKRQSASVSDADASNTEETAE